MKEKKAVKSTPKTDKLIATFMTASAPLESYLQQGNPLTDQQLELISLTVSGLNTFLDSWERKHKSKSTRSTFLSFYVRNVKKTRVSAEKS